MRNLVQFNANEIGELKGLLASAREQGLRTAIIKIPVRLFAIDETYQTPIRTNRNLSYLISNFDDNKLLPVTGVPHNEEGKIYLVDGYGRWKASQIVDAEKYKALECLVILNAPTEPRERQKFEAEQYAFQNIGTKRITPIEKQGAFYCMEYPAAITMEELRKKYGFTYVNEKGKRSAGVLGSYNEMFRVCEKYGQACADYILTVCEKARFNIKPNGYSTYVVIALRDIWRFYPEHREDTSSFLSKWLREYEPAKFKSKAVARYGMLDQRTACSLYLEDLVVDNIDLSHVRAVEGKLVTMIA